MPATLRTLLALAAILPAALPARAADQTILGRSLAITGSPTPAGRAISLRARETLTADTLAGNPVLTGAMLTISATGASPSTDTYALPPGRSSLTDKAFWSGDATRGYRYRDKAGENGPVKSLRIRKSIHGTFELRARVDGKLGPIAVAPPDAGTAGCALFEIIDGDSYSVAFADGKIRNDGASRFEVSRPTSEASCVVPRGPSPTPVGTVDPGSTLAGCDRADERITVTSSVHLDPACTYTRGIRIIASGVTLDCRGASVTRDLVLGSRQGILIETPADVPLTDVTVRNCHVSLFDNNLRVNREGFRDLAPGFEYENGTANILIENNTFSDSANTGVFINAFVEGVTFSRNSITGSGGPGLYLEAGSRGSVVAQNVVADNGWEDVIPGPASIEIGGVTIFYLSTGREGIAVDGSRNNLIRDNLVTANAAGGIFLYKNCGENASNNGHWERLYGASDNVVRNNEVTNGPNGIWVGSRAAENQLFMDCSDVPIVNTPAQKVYLDPAPDNTIEFNRVAGMTNALRIEADGTVARGNVLSGAERGVLVGSKYLTEVLATPITDTTITANTALGVTDPFTWVWGTGTTTFTANATGNGSIGLFVPGTQPTINPFLFVIEILGA